MALLSRTKPQFSLRGAIDVPGWIIPCIDAMEAEIQAVADADIPASRIQPEITRRLRSVVADTKTILATRFRETNRGRECAIASACFTDRMLAGLYRLASESAYPSASLTLGEALLLVAVGGYGRGALAPFSDIDLMFLLPYKRTAHAEQVVEFILYVLWDLGLKVGHAVRSVDECIRLAKTDMVIRTTLLDMRPLTGHDALLSDLVRRLTREVLPGTDKAFIAAKVAEREDRLEKAGDSRYRLEPNIKNGKGGLRDLHHMQWIAAHVWRIFDLTGLAEKDVFLPAEIRRFEKAEDFLWTVRTHLHLLQGRAEERLTFDIQREIAKALGYTDRSGVLEVERFMKHYFLVVKEVGELNRIFAAALEAELGPDRKFLTFATSIEGFPLKQERLSVPDTKYFVRNPVDLLRIFYVSQTTGRAIHPRAESAISRSRTLVDASFRANAAANAMFIAILDAPRPDNALRAMNEAGILGRFLPDWGRVMGQMQYDMYHVYTVDEHTLHVISNLARIENGELAEAFPLATAALHMIRSRRELYLALIMHDIAKGRGGDHSILGAQAAIKLCRRLGLGDAEIETVNWLVRWHLAMSDVALKRDLEDDQTIADFAALVQSPERLRLLLILTTCDIEAVGPGRWNSWKAGLLSELYTRTGDRLSGLSTARGSSTRIRLAHEEARRELEDWSDSEFQRFADLGAPGYWLAYDAQSHAWHARLIGEAEAHAEALAVATRVDEARAVTEIAVYALDTPQLFAQLAGGIAATGFTIVDAKISPLANGKVLDVFSVHDANGETGFVSDRRDRLVEMIGRGIEGTLKLSDELGRRGTTLIGRARALPAPARVLIDNDASHSHNVIEVNGRDRPGLLYALTRTLNEVGARVSSAKISTHGHRVVDVFYVKDHSGNKIAEGAWLHDIYVKLMAVLEER